MTRKDYVAIAEKIAETANDVETLEDIATSEVVRLLAEGIATVFKADNPRFDRARFLTACGLGEPVKDSCSA